MQFDIVKTISVLEEYIKEYFHDLGINNSSLDKTEKTLIIKEKKGKWNFTKLKFSPHQKAPLRKQMVKSQIGKNVHTTYNWQRTKDKKNNRKVGKDLNWHFTKEDR